MNTKLTELFERYPALAPLENDILTAENMMLDTYYAGGKILACGNGGSCSDANHIVGELMKGFLLKRPMTADIRAKFENALGEEAEDFAKKLQRGSPAIALDAASALFTAYANDVDADYVYAQLVFGYAKDNDMLIGISTSGNARNVCAALQVAAAMGLTTVAMTGEGGGKMGKIADITLAVPERETYKVQQLHLPAYHAICAEVERVLFED